MFGANIPYSAVWWKIIFWGDQNHSWSEQVSCLRSSMAPQRSSTLMLRAASTSLDPRLRTVRTVRMAEAQTLTWGSLMVFGDVTKRLVV